MLCHWPQYACMFIAAGQPGDARKVMASVAAARKVFRIMRVRRVAVGLRVAAWNRLHAATAAMFAFSVPVHHAS